MRAVGISFSSSIQSAAYKAGFGTSRFNSQNNVRGAYWRIIIQFLARCRISRRIRYVPPCRYYQYIGRLRKLITSVILLITTGRQSYYLNHTLPNSRVPNLIFPSVRRQRPRITYAILRTNTSQSSRRLLAVRIIDPKF